MQLGEAIKALRREKCLKQKDLSEICNISQTYLSQIENDKKQPTIEVLNNISKNLGVPVAVMFFRALDESDIDDKKRELFKILNPTIEKFINEIFFDSSDHSKA